MAGWWLRTGSIGEDGSGVRCEHEGNGDAARVLGAGWVVGIVGGDETVHHELACLQGQSEGGGGERRAVCQQLLVAVSIQRGKFGRATVV